MLLLKSKVLPVRRLTALHLCTGQWHPAPRESRNQWSLEARRCCLSQVQLSGSLVPGPAMVILWCTQNHACVVVSLGLRSADLCSAHSAFPLQESVFKEEVIPWDTFSSFHIRKIFTFQQQFLFLGALSNFRAVLGRIEEIKCLG